MKSSAWKAILIAGAVCCLAAGVATACKPVDPPITGDGGNNPGGGGGEEPGITQPVIPPYSEDGISTVDLGSMRVQLLSDTLVRIEEKGPKGFEDRASYIVSNRDGWEHVDFTVEARGANYELVTENYTVRIPQKAKGVEDVVIVSGDKILYSYAGQTDTNVYLPSPSDELKSWYFTDSPRVIPSENGYKITDDTTPLQGWDFDNNATDVFVFLPQGDYTQFCNDYVALTGSSEMVNLQTLGYWDSRWYPYSAEEALEQIETYRELGYSIDVLVIDVDWKAGDSLHGGGIGYEVNKDLFPNIEEFLEKCHELGVAVNFNDHPEPYPGTSNGLDRDEVEFRETNLKLILSMGLDYWWYDRNWHTALNSFDPDVSVFAFGMYAFQFITQDYFESITDVGEYARRALIMGNVDGCLHGKWNYASDLSAHRYTIQWTGDIGAGSEALAQEIYATIFGGAEVGIPYMSSDLGGHTQAVTDDMYVRWLQYGTLSAITRVHCTSSAYIGQEGRMPWLFENTVENTQEIVKEYISMRYHLLPLYYALSYQNYKGGVPLIRRLDINYSQYVESQRNDEYLLGDYILVAPLTEAQELTVAGVNRFSNGDGVSSTDGLKAEYYSDKNFSQLVTTVTGQNINGDWGYGGPSELGGQADNFSIKYSGTLKIGSRPAYLTFWADDKVEVFINGKLALTSVKNGENTYDNLLLLRYSDDELYFPANYTCQIEVRFTEEEGQAHIKCYYTEKPAEGSSLAYNSREVFFPDGTWIDVWTGERYVGPATYRVTHPLETSPIYVREGALVTLAEQGISTSATDWSKVALDVYPSKNFSAQTMLYEDDVTTVAYKSGHFRTTDITMNWDTSADRLVIKIGAAQGEFSGTRAFGERTWSIRLHTNPGWGAFRLARVNGSAVRNAASYKKNGDASPFAFEGAARDGDLTVFEFSGSVYDEYEIVIQFESAVDSAVNKNYDATALDFTMETGNAGVGVDLTEAGTIDWVTYGHGSSMEAVRKANGPRLFGDATSYDSPWRSYETFFTQTYTDGDVSGRGNNEGAYASQKNFDLEIKTAGKDAYYVLYVGGSQCTAKITVRDRAGNVRTEYFGDLFGNFTRRIVIHVTGTEESSLYITYAMMASETDGTGSPSKVLLLGGYATETLPEDNSGDEVEIEGELWGVTPSQGTIDLTEAFANADTLDWWQFYDEGDSAHRNEKVNGDYILDVTFLSGMGFGDYAAALKWSDGAGTGGAHTGSTNGTCTPGSITVRVKVTPEVRYIRLYTGTWQGANITTLYSVTGKRLAQAPRFSATNPSVCRTITFEVHAEEETEVIIHIGSTNAASNGNVSLAGLAVGGDFKGESVTLDYTSASPETTVNLTEQGATDWLYVGSRAEKSDGTAISSFETSPYTAAFSDYSASLSYTGGTDGSHQNLKSGLNVDFLRFNVAVNTGTEYIKLYVRAADGASAGVTVVGADGQVLLYEQPLAAPSGTGYACITINVHALTSTTLTVMFYKGGNGSGSAGVAAIAVK